jgi:hypothetical protein
MTVDPPYPVRSVNEWQQDTPLNRIFLKISEFSRTVDARLHALARMHPDLGKNTLTLGPNQVITDYSIPRDCDGNRVDFTIHDLYYSVVL